MDLSKLKDKFAPLDIEWRIQRNGKTQAGTQWGMVLAYVTNRAIMERLDEVCGEGNWKNEFKEWRDKGILCGISIKIDKEWVEKFDGAEETAVEATKGGFSASMKRAGVQWGIGRYLYNLETTMINIVSKKDTTNGFTNYINDKKTGVVGYWKNPALPKWALPTEKIEPKVEIKKESEVKNGK